MQSQIKKFLLLLCFDMLGSTLYSIGIATFAQKADFAPGGVLGFALILYHLWGFPVGVTSLLLNLPLAALSIRALGRNSLYKTIQSMVCYTILLDGIFPYIPYYDGSSMLAALFSGIFFGYGYGNILYAWFIIWRNGLFDIVDSVKETEVFHWLCYNDD